MMVKIARKSLLFAGLLSLIALASANAQWRDATIAQLRQIADPIFGHGVSTEPQFDQFYAGMVEALPPQAQVERALELAINRFDGATDYIVDKVPDWHDQIESTPVLQALITTALNSPKLEVRMAALEVHLAQYALDKTPEEIDHLIERLEANPQGAGPWALWNAASIGALGVDRERVFDLLLSYSSVDDVYLRTWAVNAMAKFGGEEVVQPLLDIAAADSSAQVRERAFCGVAQSGMLHITERYSAIPTLLAIADDHQQDQQTRGWAFQALREITNTYDLPEQTELWTERMQQLGLL